MSKSFAFCRKTLQTSLRKKFDQEKKEELSLDCKERTDGRTGRWTFEERQSVVRRPALVLLNVEGFVMKFAHMADCHLGSWSNHPDMREYPVLAFEFAIDECIKEGVDFIIIAGDLFDTSLPPIDVQARTAAKLRECKEHGIAVYAIPGSHDYSPSGKTMLSVFEAAGLLVNVFKYEEVDDKIRLKFTTDRKTGAKLTGIMGRKGSLEISYYKKLDKSIENESGFKIFVFHAGLEEYKPPVMKDMITVSGNDLPKNFDYYASGHVHTQLFDEKFRVVFPGELFPTSFDELEDYNGGFVLVETDSKNNLDVKWKNARLFDVTMMKFDVTGKSTSEIEKDIISRIESNDLSGSVLLLKLYGTIEAGRVSDINFDEIVKRAHAKGAKIVKRSTSAVSVKEFEKLEITGTLSTDQIEKGLIEKHAEQLQIAGVDDVKDFVMNMMNALKEEKQEDETNATFEERLKTNAKKVAGL